MRNFFDISSECYDNDKIQTEYIVLDLLPSGFSYVVKSEEDVIQFTVSNPNTAVQQGEQELQIKFTLSGLVTDTRTFKFKFVPEECNLAQITLKQIIEPQKISYGETLDLDLTPYLESDYPDCFDVKVYVDDTEIS